MSRQKRNLISPSCSQIGQHPLTTSTSSGIKTTMLVYKNELRETRPPIRFRTWSSKENWLLLVRILINWQLPKLMSTLKVIISSQCRQSHRLLMMNQMTLLPPFSSREIISNHNLVLGLLNPLQGYQTLLTFHEHRQKVSSILVSQQSK